MDKRVARLGRVLLLQSVWLPQCVPQCDWVQYLSAGGGHYLCPACGQHYGPWLEKPRYFKANQIWVTDLRSQTIAGPRAGDMSRGEESDYRIAPIVWAYPTVGGLLPYTGRAQGLPGDRMAMLASHLTTKRVFVSFHLADGVWGARIPEGVDLDSLATQEHVFRVIAMEAYMRLSPRRQPCL